MKFLPTTKDELKKLGWDELDVILISGDSYIDSPYIGLSVIGRYLVKHGYRDSANRNSSGGSAVVR